MDRRSMIGGGLAAGMTGLFAAEPMAAAADDADDVRLARGVEDLRKSFERRFQETDVGRLREVALIRQQQRTYLKSTQKYPDFIEVGVDIWEGIYDWHVKNQLPINATRLADGRYILSFMFTTLILRPEQSGDYVGFGFDSETARR